MKFTLKISKEKDAFLGVPVYFVDKEEKDIYSRTEIHNLMAFVTFLEPIQKIIKNKNVIKEEYYQYDIRENIYEEGKYIKTKLELLKRKVKKFYDGKVSFGDWEVY